MDIEKAVFSEMKDQLHDLMCKQLTHFNPQDIWLFQGFISLKLYNDYKDLKEDKSERCIPIVGCSTPNGAVWTWTLNRLLKTKQSS